MTLRLILTRHAKSSWSDPMIDDHDRPLNTRGRSSAKAVGTWLAGSSYVPGQVLVSSSERTRETWALVAQSLENAPTPVIRPDLYHAEPEAMLAALREATARVVMMVAHNPGCAYFAQGLVETPSTDARFSRFPTAATAVIDFEHDIWGDVAWRTGRLTDLAFARDLV
jgi:phosphohistidine phosphatase